MFFWQFDDWNCFIDLYKQKKNDLQSLKYVSSSMAQEVKFFVFIFKIIIIVLYLILIGIISKLGLKFDKKCLKIEKK